MIYSIFLLLLLAESKDCNENEKNVLEELMTELKVVLTTLLFFNWETICLPVFSKCRNDKTIWVCSVTVMKQLDQNLYLA